MKMKIIKSTLLVLLIGLSTLANSQNLALIEGYQLDNKQSEKKDIEIKVTSKQINKVKNEEPKNDKLAINNLFKPSNDTLFYESFNGNTLDNKLVLVR